MRPDAFPGEKNGGRVGFVVPSCGACEMQGEALIIVAAAANEWKAFLRAVGR